MSVATLPRALALGLAALAAVAAVGITPRLLTPEAIAQPQPAGGVDWPEITASVTTKSHEVVDGETASEVLNALGAPTRALIAGARGGLDRVGVGDLFLLDTRRGEAQPWRLRVERGEPTVFALVLEGDRYKPSRLPIPYTIETGAKTLTVTSSLWAAALAAGLRPSQIMGVASIFEYDVDFNTELLPGAVIQLGADTLTDEAGNVRVGDIRAARLQNGSKSFVQIRYRMLDGTVGWFKPDGTGARKAFLRSPLAFTHVTSGFSAKGRFHPVLKINRPHLGVDLGAPSGTPIRAVADGVVTKAGPSGGHGNHVELDHEGPYATSYSHLSVILVKRGRTVRQGDIIGRVGMTGLATGPHLHYQFFVNGRYANPMTVDLPKSGSSELLAAEKEAFFKVRDAVIGMVGG